MRHHENEERRDEQGNFAKRRDCPLAPERVTGMDRVPEDAEVSPMREPATLQVITY